MRATFYRGAYANSGLVGSLAARSLVNSAAQQRVNPNPRRSDHQPSASSLHKLAEGDDMALRAEYRAWREGSAAAGVALRRTPTTHLLSSAAPDKPQPKAIPRLLRDFAPGRVLGRGAFGVVVAARSRADPSTEYAIKIMAWHADVDAGALGEVRAHSSLPFGNPNLVSYHGAWVEAGGEWVSELTSHVTEGALVGKGAAGEGARWLLSVDSGSSLSSEEEEQNSSAYRIDYF